MDRFSLVSVVATLKSLLNRSLCKDYSSLSADLDSNYWSGMV